MYLLLWHVSVWVYILCVYVCVYVYVYIYIYMMLNKSLKLHTLRNAVALPAPFHRDYLDAELLHTIPCRVNIAVLHGLRPKTRPPTPKPQTPKPKLLSTL